MGGRPNKGTPKDGLTESTGKPEGGMSALWAS